MLRPKCSPSDRRSPSPAPAACILVGGLLGWAMGNVGYGVAIGAVVGIPTGVAATVIKYRNA